MDFNYTIVLKTGEEIRCMSYSEQAQGVFYILTNSSDVTTPQGFVPISNLKYIYPNR